MATFTLPPEPLRCSAPGRVMVVEKTVGDAARDLGSDLKSDLKFDLETDLETDLEWDLEPTSEVRPIDARARRLVVDIGLRGAEAEAAWVTVSDDAGAVFFEGPPSADGCIDVSFESEPQVRRVRVRLETARLHRTAEVELNDGWTAYAFAG